MSAVAQILVRQGMEVRGSDSHDSPVLDVLRTLGCDITVGQHADNIGDPSVVIVSGAIPETNPELVAARARSLPVVHRAQALALAMTGHRSVVVAGTHGKSSTTAMLARILVDLGFDPSVAFGAEVTGPGTNARHGKGKLFVVEADEADRSFLFFRPDVAVLMNIEEDHHDNYSSLDQHIAANEQFVRRISDGGTFVACVDDSGVTQLLARMRETFVRHSRPMPQIITFGTHGSANVRATRITSNAQGSDVVVRAGNHEVSLSLSVPGRHFALNGVGALAAAAALGIDLGRAAKALENYTGIMRRFNLVGTARGIGVFDSYAHHPSEVSADVAMAKDVVAPGGRVLVLFQPHKPSRVGQLGESLGVALAAADVAVVLPIYNSHETPVRGVTSHLVADAAAKAGLPAFLAASRSAAVHRIAGLAREGDLIITMGAGDVTELGPRILHHLRQPAGAASQ